MRTIRDARGSRHGAVLAYREGNSGRWIDRAYNVAPTSQVPMVLLNEAGEQEVVVARWGLIPFWWKKEKPPALTFNARSEEAPTKPM